MSELIALTPRQPSRLEAAGRRASQQPADPPDQRNGVWDYDSHGRQIPYRQWPGGRSEQPQHISREAVIVMSEQIIYLLPSEHRQLLRLGEWLNRHGLHLVQRVPGGDVSGELRMRA